jgi:Wax ester synthase-like Acyl-CoA acyltransferase domain/WS/DGAT C-terminal domain
MDTHIGSVAIFEGPAPRHQILEATRTALPAPGGDADLRDLVARVMSQQPGRKRPLPEAWIVEGLSDGRWAVIGTDLLSALLDDRRNRAPAPKDGSDLRAVAAPLAEGDASWGWARGSLADVDAVRRVFGGTVNDVVFAAITVGLRDLLRSRGEAMVGLADPVACLDEIRRQTDDGEDSHQGLSVPGAQQPLYAVGRRMLETFPFVAPGGHLGVGVAVFSYNGALSFGVSGADLDVDVLCRGIERGLDELAARAEPWLREPVSRAWARRSGSAASR